MKKQETMKTCRKCGKLIGIIESGVYRKILVDAQAVEVIADPDGEMFVRIDGTKIRGKEADTGAIQLKTEWVYRPHKCGGSR